jgi:hypothetical protein
MARPPSTFRQQDVTRAIRAAIAAGVDIARIEVDSKGIYGGLPSPICRPPPLPRRAQPAPPEPLGAVTAYHRVC